MKILVKTVLVCVLVLICNSAFADGIAHPWQIGFQEPASEVMESLNKFHHVLLIIIFAISVFVLGLIAYISLKFNAKANPTPSSTSHNTVLEIVWTVAPVIILILIAIPSMRLLYEAEVVPEAEMTLKVTGYQWYWGYQYPDNGNFFFESRMIEDKDLKPGEPRLLTVDNQVVLPIDTTIRIQITAQDVIHSWAMPSMAIKKDAVPGKLNETWLKIEKPGTYYGQCSELCGSGHGFMPIVIHAVSKEEFTTWVEKAKQEFASYGQSNIGSVALNIKN